MRCAGPDMPRSACAAVSPDVIAPIEEITTAIIDATKILTGKEVDMDKQKHTALETDFHTVQSVVTRRTIPARGQRSKLTRPDSEGIVWRIGEDLPLRYRCHTGHAFSAMSLASKQRDGAEEALWSALRRLQESLLTQDQLVLAQAARSADVEQLSARTARSQMAVEATRQLALWRRRLPPRRPMTCSATPIVDDLDAGRLDLIWAKAEATRSLPTGS